MSRHLTVILPKGLVVDVYDSPEVENKEVLLGAIDKAIEALMKAYCFEHVIIEHPIYGDCDGLIDRQRMLLFLNPITCELARQFGINWRMDKSPKDKETLLETIDKANEELKREADNDR